MARKKMKFNRKLFNRFKKKELTDFIKGSILPMEKLSKMSKGEIVVNLIRLQRNKLYYDTFANLKIKAPREMSAKQKANLALARTKMKQANKQVKESFPQSQKLDVGRKVVNKNNVETNEIKSLSKLVSQKPTALEQAKLDVPELSETGEQDLEELFVMSNRTINEHREQIMQMLEARKKEVGRNGGNQGKVSLEQAREQQAVQEPQLQLSRVEVEQQPRPELEPEFELEALQESPLAIGSSSVSQELSLVLAQVPQISVEDQQQNVIRLGELITANLNNPLNVVRENVNLELGLMVGGFPDFSASQRRTLIAQLRTFVLKKINQQRSIEAPSTEPVVTFPEDEEEQKEEQVVLEETGATIEEAELQKSGVSSSDKKVINDVVNKLNKLKIDQSQVDALGREFGLNFDTKARGGGTIRQKLRRIIEVGGQPAFELLQKLSTMSKARFTEEIGQLSPEPLVEEPDELVVAKRKPKKKSKSRVIVKKKN